MCHFACAESMKELRELAYDLPYEAAGFFVHRWSKNLLGKGYWNHHSPGSDAPDTYRKVELMAKQILPGSRFRRRAVTL